MKKKTERTPKNYDGTKLTGHKVGDLLSTVLSKINAVQHERPDLVLAAWPEIIGPKLASMTQAISLFQGVMVVKVKSSTLLSLLNRNDKYRILVAIREKFPKVDIQNIVFRIA